MTPEQFMQAYHAATTAVIVALWVKVWQMEKKYSDCLQGKLDKSDDSD